MNNEFKINDGIKFRQSTSDRASFGQTKSFTHRNLRFPFLKRGAGIVLIGVLVCLVSMARGAPKAQFIDPETGYEVWRMTDWDGKDITQYYHNPCFSPNGKYILFRTNRAPFAWIMNTDGSGEKAIGTYNDWFSPSRKVDFSSSEMLGYWSHDSREFYTRENLYKINIESFMRGDGASSFIQQISAVHASNFFHPFVSPDGKRLFGLSNESDVYTGYGTLKFINVDGTGYEEFVPPHIPQDSGFDVSHGWLGNDHAWYMVQIGKVGTPQCCYSDLPVFNTNDGSDRGLLNVHDPAGADPYYCSIGHPTLSPAAFSTGDGLIAGHARFPSGGTVMTLLGNTNYGSQNPVEREIRYLVDRAVYPEFHPYGYHDNFNPSGSLLLVVNSYGNLGMFAAYPVKKDSSPIWVARFSPKEASQFNPNPTWSSDGTKILFNSSYMPMAPGNDDLYMVIFKKPDTPTGLKLFEQGSQINLTWNPASQHREIKEYQIFQSATRDGTYTKIATVPEVYTYLSAASKIGPSDTTISVDSTAGFPDQGVIEVLGLSTERSTELIAYTGKTAVSFTGCSRGMNGTTAAEHYNDAFVWLHRGTHGYPGNYVSGAWYKVSSVEWSGLVSDPSEPVSGGVIVPVTTLTVTKSGPGSGTITSQPSGIACGLDCTQDYNENTVVALTQTPAPGSTFTGWLGACSGTGACQVTMNTNQSVSATFAAQTISIEIEAESCTRNAPFVISNGPPVSIYQPTTNVPLDDPTVGGELICPITIPANGTYIVEAMVRAQGDATNAFFLNFDTQPNNVAMIWDILPYTNAAGGFETRSASWRGSGTYNAPQFSPKVFDLSVGSHNLIIRGREANTFIDRISIVAQSISDSPHPADTNGDHHITIAELTEYGTCWKTPSCTWDNDTNPATAATAIPMDDLLQAGLIAKTGTGAGAGAYAFNPSLPRPSCWVPGE